MRRGRWLVPLLFMAVAVPASSVVPSWQERRDALIARHVWFTKVIHQLDLLQFRKLYHSAQNLPLEESQGVAYLIQGEEDTEEKQAAMWSDVSDVFVITFRTRRRDALFFPNSLLAEGRNALLGAAAYQELLRGFRYRYYVFMDADAEAKPNWSIATVRFEKFLVDWEPAVGIPVLSNSHFEPIDMHRLPYAVFHFDHIFLAVHTEAAGSLLPLDTAFDGLCSWVSQWSLTLVATALFRHHVILVPSVHVVNVEHSKYPKDDCILHMANASARLRALAPHAESCFPNPAHGLAMIKGTIGRFTYISLGNATKKRDGHVLHTYSGASLEHATPCDGEVFASVTKQDFYSPECIGCSPEVTFLTLQLATAAMPRSERNWNALGAWYTRVAPFEGTVQAQVDTFTMAAICFAVANRLDHVNGKQQSPILLSNIREVNKVLFSAGLQKPVDSEEFWANRGKVASHGIRSVLTVADWQAAGLDCCGQLMSDESMSNFLEVLGCYQ